MKKMNQESPVEAEVSQDTKITLWSHAYFLEVCQKLDFKFLLANERKETL